jgi:hypothetical protein
LRSGGAKSRLVTSGCPRPKLLSVDESFGTRRGTKVVSVAVGNAGARSMPLPKFAERLDERSKELLQAALRVGTWFPDETLFSLGARQHRLSGEGNCSETCRLLFAHSRLGSAHDLPSRVDRFVERTGGAYGTAEEIIRAATVLPFYLVFRDETTVEIAFNALRRDSGIQGLKFRLGMITSNFRAHHPLRACPACMQADRDAGRVPYWHRMHQFPGVVVCPIHGVPLLEANVKANGVERFGWVLPVQCTAMWYEAPPSIQEHAEPLGAFATLANDFGGMEPASLADISRRKSLYRNALQDRDLFRRGRISPNAAGEQFGEFLRTIGSAPVLSGLWSTNEDAARRLTEHIQDRSRPCHPLRELALISWLFGNIDSFRQAYERQEEGARPELLAAHEPTSDARSAGQRTLLTLLADGASVSCAARLLDIDTTTAMAWAASAGVTNHRRPKLLSGEIRIAAIASLRSGASKATVASDLSVSNSTVTRLLRTEIGLRDAWNRARKQRAASQAQEAWMKEASSNQHTAKSIRREIPAAYAWLRRNDPNWLRKQTALLPPARHDGGRKVDWVARDHELAVQVTAALGQLQRRNPQRAKRWEIVQLVPGLKPFLRCLGRVPTKQGLIRRALAHCEATGASDAAVSEASTALPITTR